MQLRREVKLKGLGVILRLPKPLCRFTEFRLSAMEISDPRSGGVHNCYSQRALAEGWSTIAKVFVEQLKHI